MPRQRRGVCAHQIARQHDAALPDHRARAVPRRRVGQRRAARGPHAASAAAAAFLSAAAAVVASPLLQPQSGGRASDGVADHDVVAEPVRLHHELALVLRQHQPLRRCEVLLRLLGQRRIEADGVPKGLGRRPKGAGVELRTREREARFCPVGPAVRCGRGCLDGTGRVVHLEQALSQRLQNVGPAWVECLRLAKERGRLRELARLRRVVGAGDEPLRVQHADWRPRIWGFARVGVLTSGHMLIVGWLPEASLAA